ncbi:energy transducer TonB [Flavobacterium caeni]|uniref:TonB protein C-terminal n=1 Tax=Flavobacterium caeni TaxID=490189 RepID=A0A1G5K9Z3_9FLAO|nr:energy transducer TonB [Flavobacterium caeni]SCY96830.1 TonB protein C-terminal [Flavobacterium caeni]
MKKIALLLLVLTATFATAQTGADNRIFSNKEIDVLPVPENGVTLADHFKKNFKPKEKPAEPIKVSFVIEKGGVLRDIKVFGELPDATKKEAVRVIKLLPKWKPGSKGGKTVRVLYTATLNP